MADISYNTAPDWRTTYFDDQGVALIDGTLEFFKATDHGTQKAVYQSNIITPPATTPPSYPNPIVLVAGANVAAIFYASDENYYIELRKPWPSPSVKGVLVQDVDNWNSPENTDPTPKATEVDFTNYIVNSGFNVLNKAKFFSSELTTAVTLICDPAWYFHRDNTNGTNTIEFLGFIAGQTDVPFNPNAYMRYSCSAVGAGGEASKHINYRFSDVNTLSGEEFVVTFYARSSLNDVIRISMLQEFGVGGSGSVDTSIETINLSSLWTKYVVKGTIPSISGKVVGTGEVDLWLLINLPLNSISEIDIAIPDLVRGDEELEYSYRTKEQNIGDTNSILIEPPPTLYPVAYDPKTIVSGGNGSAYVWEPAVPAGIVYPFAGPSSRIPDGHLLCNGLNVFRAVFNRLYGAIERDYGYEYSLAIRSGNVVTVTAKMNGVVTDVSAGTSGFTVNVTQQGTAGLPEIFTVTTTDAASITPGSYLTFSLRNNSSVEDNFYFWFFKGNSGVDPALGGKTGVRIDIPYIADADGVAEGITDAFDPLAFAVPDYPGYFLRGVDDGAGVDPDAASRTDRGDGSTGDVVGTVQTTQLWTHTHGVSVTGNYDKATANAYNVTPGIINNVADHPLIQTPTVVNSTGSAAATGGNESRPPNKSVNFIIKY